MPRVMPALPAHQTPSTWAPHLHLTAKSPLPDSDYTPNLKERSKKTHTSAPMSCCAAAACAPNYHDEDKPNWLVDLDVEGSDEVAQPVTQEHYETKDEIEMVLGHSHDKEMEDYPSQASMKPQLMQRNQYVVCCASIRSSLLAHIKFYKLQVLPNASSEAARFNANYKPMTIADHNDPYRIEWLGSAANPITTKEYFISEKDLSVILVIPNYYDRFSVRELVNVLLVQMGFTQVIVDIGTVKTSKWFPTLSMSEDPDHIKCGLSDLWTGSGHDGCTAGHLESHCIGRLLQDGVLGAPDQSPSRDHNAASWRGQGRHKGLESADVTVPLTDHPAHDHDPKRDTIGCKKAANHLFLFDVAKVTKDLPEDTLQDLVINS
ncbi:actin-like protein arp8, partial [Ceratobasidium sp. 370]